MDITLKRKLLLIWRVIKACVMNTIKASDWLAIYEILLNGYARDKAASDEDALARRVNRKE